MVGKGRCGARQRNINQFNGIKGKMCEPNRKSSYTKQDEERQRVRTGSLNKG